MRRDGSSFEQELLAPAAVPLRLSAVDLSALPAGERQRARTQQAEEAQASLSLERGEVHRAILFTAAGEPDRLLIVIHHMAVDGVSWRILLEDLHTAYVALERGEAVSLPQKTTSLPRRGEALLRHARSAQTKWEMEHWLQMLSAEVPPMPVDRPAVAAENLVAATEVITVALEPQTTRRLLRECGEAYRTQINDLLVTALAIAWKRWAGSSELLLDLEAHGREQVDEHSNVERTLGWFTSLFPARLRLPPSVGIGEQVMAIKEQLRALPKGGLTYGVLRYLGEQTVRSRLATSPQPQLCFNYLGQFDASPAGGDLFELVDEPVGRSRGPLNRRPWLIEMDAFVVGEQLRLQLTYHSTTHRRATAQALADAYLAALREVIQCCVSRPGARCTPSDFGLAGLDQDELDRLAALVGGTEDS